MQGRPHSGCIGAMRRPRFPPVPPNVPTCLSPDGGQLGQAGPWDRGSHRNGNALASHTRLDRAGKRKDRLCPFFYPHGSYSSKTPKACIGILAVNSSSPGCSLFTLAQPAEIGRKRNGRSGACEAGNLPFVRPTVIDRFRPIADFGCGSMEPPRMTQKPIRKMTKGDRCRKG